MESQWIVDRARLRRLHQQHPQWKQKRLAQQLGYSSTWVKKWLKRFAEAALDDDSGVIQPLSVTRPPSEAGNARGRREDSRN